jgi:hypothetical protein
LAETEPESEDLCRLRRVKGDLVVVLEPSMTALSQGSLLTLKVPMTGPAEGTPEGGLVTGVMGRSCGTMGPAAPGVRPGVIPGVVADVVDGVLPDGEVTATSVMTMEGLVATTASRAASKDPRASKKGFGWGSIAMLYCGGLVICCPMIWSSAGLSRTGMSSSAIESVVSPPSSLSSTPDQSALVSESSLASSSMRRCCSPAEADVLSPMEPAVREPVPRSRRRLCRGWTRTNCPSQFSMRTRGSSPAVWLKRVEKPNSSQASSVSDDVESLMGSSDEA